MTTHTKGPWTIEEYIFMSGITAVENSVIAKNQKHQCADTDLANASLIAAATELLEALKAVLKVADRHTDKFKLARSAIAKAATE